jgi:hypothetical protein
LHSAERCKFRVLRARVLATRARFRADGWVNVEGKLGPTLRALGAPVVRVPVWMKMDLIIRVRWMMPPEVALVNAAWLRREPHHADARIWGPRGHVVFSLKKGTRTRARARLKAYLDWLKSSDDAFAMLSRVALGENVDNVIDEVTVALLRTISTEGLRLLATAEVD